MKVRIGSRPSDLALAQSRKIQKRIESLPEKPETELIIITTSGDRIQNIPLSQAASPDDRKGFFTKEIEDALLENRIDAAVHSYKDLPSLDVPGLTVAAIPERVETYDLLVFPSEKKIRDDFPYIAPGSTVGTASVRRLALLEKYCPEMKTSALRGNVPTRIRKLFDPSAGLDAVLLAGAGVNRLIESGFFAGENGDLLKKVTMVPLDPQTFVPAPAQGALAVQCRASDKETLALLNQLNDLSVRECLKAERDVLSALEGGCHLPLGVSCEKKPDGSFRMMVFLGKEAQDNRLGRSYGFFREGKNPELLAKRTATEIKKGYPIAIVGREERLQELARSHSKEIIPLPLLSIKYSEDAAVIKKIRNWAERKEAGEKTAAAAFSVPAVESFHALLLSQKLNPGKISWLVTGNSTALAARRLFPESEILLSSSNGTAKNLAVEYLRTGTSENLIVLCAEDGRDDFFNTLDRERAAYARAPVYRTIRKNAEEKDLRQLLEECCILFGSPSAAQAFYPAYLTLHGAARPGHMFCAIGPTTASEMRSLGIEIYAVSPSPDFDALIEEIGARADR